MPQGSRDDGVSRGLRVLLRTATPDASGSQSATTGTLASDAHSLTTIADGPSFASALR